MKIKFWNPVLEEFWEDKWVDEGNLLIDRFGVVGSIEDGDISIKIN